MIRIVLFVQGAKKYLSKYTPIISRVERFNILSKKYEPLKDIEITTSEFLTSFNDLFQELGIVDIEENRYAIHSENDKEDGNLSHDLTDFINSIKDKDIFTYEDVLNWCNSLNNPAYKLTENVREKLWELLLCQPNSTK